MPLSPTGEREGRVGLDCGRCGSLCTPGQEYCLECGDRLSAQAAATVYAAVPRPRRLVAAWPVLVALVVATLAAAVVLISDRGDAVANDPIIAPLPRPDGPPPEEELAEIEPPPEATPTRAPPPAQRPRRRRPDAAGRAIVQWPAGRRQGFTVVLASIPDVRGRGSATETAQAAARAGLARVGVLNPDVFASLHPGYYVVFNGIHNTRAAAERAVDAAQSAGFEDAYVAEVAR